ncbi:bile acid:sodium symporter family protein [Alloalcanivorax xenomutans]|uniref:bile acid:sodium symporter family protein n=1 Tax=Alloalcanivorax xenomutans TaxID=1094342 RepID=UPI003BABBA86
MGPDTPIDFSTGNLIVLNVILALMMFGVSLSLRVEDFRRVLRMPQAPAAGLLAQFLLLPALTCVVTWVLDVEPGLALGMILVASCPGGTFSNIMTWLARANVAVSVSMTAVSSLAATILTPLNFAFYGWLNPHTRDLVTEIALNPWNIRMLVVLVLAVPLLLGMLTGRHFPRFAVRAQKPMRVFTLLVLLAFVGLAFAKNLDVFLQNAHRIVALVIGQNALALALGACAGMMMRLDRADRRAVTLEVGIQNSGLGLAILFTFFPQAAGMILIAGFWGVWHLVSGLILALIWSRGTEPARSGWEAS